MAMIRFPLLAVLALAPAACGVVPDFRPGTPPMQVQPPPPQVTVAPPAPFEGPPGLPRAAAAEAACTAAGRERGFQVQGVVGSTEVMGPDGQPASRDVMLRVERGGQVFDLRCNYHYASAQARVMAL